MKRFLFLASCFLVIACGDDGPSTGDSDAATVCEADSDCSDSNYCNGAETCDPTNAAANANGCVPGERPCPMGVMCDEDADECGSACEDTDGDGELPIECGGADCDDNDPARYPGNMEICDAMDRDEDCDPRTFGFRDNDMDGAPDALCCNEAADGTRMCGADCNDANAVVGGSAIEACDTLDNDCDGMVDEMVLSTYWEDGDGDGFGDPDGEVRMGCSQPSGFAENDGDCDDTVAAINPAAAERCTDADVDENCDGVIDPVEECSCDEGDTQPCTLPGVCAAGVETCDSGSWSATCSITPEVEVCNGFDDNCDGATDEGLTVACYEDSDNDGYAASGAMLSNRCPQSSRPEVGGCPTGTTDREPTGANVDCNDGNSSVRPGTPEVCVEGSAVDDDCDGMVDEGVAVLCYTDGDNDTYPADSSATSRCADDGRPAVGRCPSGTTNTVPSDSTTDCDDSTFAINPAATERCETTEDDNCSGEANEDCECTPPASRSCAEGGIVGACSTGSQSCEAGAWGDCDIAPAPTELSCDGMDEDCDGATDEGLLVNCYVDGDDDGYAAAGAMPTPSCTCGSMATSRAPTTGNVDCNDTVASINPGATELCDGLDTDCDGTDPRPEDRDGDGYTAIGFSGCSGGFDKTDCSDYYATAFPGQTEHQAVPRCDDDERPCRCIPPSGGVRSVTRCFSLDDYPASGSCPDSSLDCPFLVPTRTSYDYNCDGMETREPPVTSCGSSGTFCSVSACAAEGQTFLRPYNCGDQEEYRFCSCNRFFTSCVQEFRTVAGRCR